ncbi:MAG: hypothetical protein KDD10_10505 [Phaeodactylibacter sp.]|nr:hypothetical protein [Phaeodactylibacter sp.]
MPEKRPTPKPHQTRPIRFLRYLHHGEWTAKIYGICQGSLSNNCQDERPGEMLLQRAQEITRRILPTPGITAERYALAFVIIHQARLFNTITIDWWERDNELRHRVFRAYPEAPSRFEDITASGEAACVWELRILAFEREAWMKHILRKVPEPDWEGYLNEQLNEEA